MFNILNEAIIAFYSSSIFFVQKLDKKIWFYIDYQKLTAIIKKIAISYYLPKKH